MHVRSTSSLLLRCTVIYFKYNKQFFAPFYTSPTKSDLVSIANSHGLSIVGNILQTKMRFTLYSYQGNDVWSGWGGGGAFPLISTLNLWLHLSSESFSGLHEFTTILVLKIVAKVFLFLTLEFCKFL